MRILLPFEREREKELRNRSTPFVFWHSHVNLNRRRESRKPRTPYRGCLRSRTSRQHTTCDTPTRDTVPDVVFSAEPFNRALGAAEDGADLGKVLSRRFRRLVHVAQADFKLLAEREVRKRDGGGGGEG